MSVFHHDVNNDRDEEFEDVTGISNLSAIYFAFIGGSAMHGLVAKQLKISLEGYKKLISGIYYTLKGVNMGKIVLLYAKR